MGRLSVHIYKKPTPGPTREGNLMYVPCALRLVLCAACSAPHTLKGELKT